MRLRDILAYPLYVAFYWRPWRDRTDQFHCLGCDQKFNLRYWWRPLGFTVEQVTEHHRKCCAEGPI